MSFYPPPSPVSSAALAAAQNIPWRKDTDTEALHLALEELSKRAKESEEEMRNLREFTQQWRQERDENDFYLTIARRVRSLSVETQNWMEQEIWKLYQQAIEHEPQAQAAEEAGALPQQQVVFASSFNIAQQQWAMDYEPPAEAAFSVCDACTFAHILLVHISVIQLLALR